MTPSEVFSIANMIAMPMWLLMILLPRWRVTRLLIDYKVVPIVLSAVYALYIFLVIAGGGAINFGSLEAVMKIFTQENAVLAGWVHYLAFDLIVGMWMIDSNRDVGIHQLLMAPCLLATFMLGPIGFLMFKIIQSLKFKKS